jgi:hypothetical protein
MPLLGQRITSREEMRSMDGIPVIDAIVHADDSSEDNFANDQAVQIVDEAHLLNPQQNEYPQGSDSS